MGGVRLSKHELQGLRTTDDTAGRKKLKGIMRYDVTLQMFDNTLRFCPQCTNAAESIKQYDEDDLLECIKGDHGHHLLPATPLKQCIQKTCVAQNVQNITLLTL